MTSSTGAVSDYELLNRKLHHRAVLEQHSSYNSDDEDFLPLKPKRLAQGFANKGLPFHDTINVNNSNISEPEKTAWDATRQSTLFDDMGQSVHSVPEPFAWSPGMIITSNPSLFITPQKSSVSKSKELSLPRKENYLEPESVNKIPKPVAWSPGMVVQLDPNLFITPEKCVGQKIMTGIIGGKKEHTTKTDIIGDKKEHTTKTDIIGDKKEHTTKTGIIGDKKEHTTKTGNLVKGSAPTKTKEAYSVRFDLPSSTSGDETTESVSESDSPITLRGCEMRTGSQHFESPVWKTFSPQRIYNPNAYSNETSLDESIINTLPTTKRSPSYDNLKTSVTGSTSNNSNINPNYAFSKSPASTSEVASSYSGILKPNEIIPNLAVGGKRDAKYSILNPKPHKMDHSKSNILATTKPKSHNDMKLLEKSTTKGESHLINSPSSLWESPSTESTVIREMKDNLLSTEYSFPFELRAATEDAEYEHVFTRPEFNSTLKVRAELNSLYEQEVDVATAVKASLAKSEVKRSELNEKAAACTNRMSSQFKNLIDLNTSVETLCDRIVRMRTSKAVIKKRGPHVDKKLTGPDRTPDLLEFFTPDLQKESPDLTLPGVAHMSSKLMTAPQDLAFDLYRHNRIWQGISDF